MTNIFLFDSVMKKISRTRTKHISTILWLGCPAWAPDVTAASLALDLQGFSEIGAENGFVERVAGENLGAVWLGLKVHAFFYLRLVWRVANTVFVYDPQVIC